MYSKRHLQRLKKKETDIWLSKFRRVEMEVCNEDNEVEVKVEETVIGDGLEWILPSNAGVDIKPQDTWCNNCSNVNDQLTEKFGDMVETVKQENRVSRESLKLETRVIRGQLQIVVEALAEQKVMIRQLLKQEVYDHSLQNKFPLETEEDMLLLNEEINPDNMEQYATAIKAAIGPLGVRKGLKNIMSDAITQEYNIDGLQRKKSLKSVENVFSALLAAIPEGLTGTSEIQLRDAISQQKKRFFKRKCIAKKLANANLLD